MNGEPAVARTTRSHSTGASVLPAPPRPAPLSGAGGSGGVAGAPPLTFFGLFAALVAALGLAAQRLSRWLRLAPDLVRPPLLASVLERPG